MLIVNRRKFITGIAALAAYNSLNEAKADRLRLQTGKHDKWSPYLLTPSVLKAWWNADDLSAGAVTTWTDRVGAIAPTQATSSKRPVQAASSFNSAYPGVTFDGVDDNLSISSVGLMPVTTAESWIFLACSAITTAAITVAFGYGANSSHAARYIAKTAADKFSASDFTTTLSDTGAVITGAQILAADFSGATMFGWINGVASGPASAAAAFSTSTTRTVIGINPNVVNNPFNGIIRHIIVTGALTTSQRQQIEGWLAWNCDLTARLASNHPYRNTAP